MKKRIQLYLQSNKEILWNQYKHLIPLLLYMVFYMTWWTHLEGTVTTDYRVIHMEIDDHIPFLEIFIIPYVAWFAYVSVTVLALFFKDDTKRDYYRCLAFLFTGMTLFLLISTLMPNGHQLRPQVMPRDNVFTHMIAALWRSDTPTNLWPSIHVYNSLGAHFAIAKSKAFENHKVIRFASLLLALSIILSTMFIKQHSFFDVLTAVFLAIVMYVIVYKRNHETTPQSETPAHHEAVASAKE
ncbi:MAG: serine/threonine protein phosphatase [Lachnospiraceae bacterium]|nr:serine/threonine protein phosphatase [Lachnospiraceae bacterium]